MNKIFILGIVFLSLFSSGYATTNDAEAYWTLDNILTDESGNGHTLTNTGATYTGSGKINGAYDFDGSNDYMTYDENITNGVGAFTISTWINLDTTVGRHPIFTNWETAPVNILLRVRDGNLHFYVDTSSGQIGGTTQAFSTTGSWVHLVAWYDGTTMKTYVDTVESGTTFSQTGTLDAGNYPRIGKSGTNYFDGTIDEVAVYTRALTTGEISALYNGGSGYNPYAGAPINDTTVPVVTLNTPTNNSYVNSNIITFNTTINDDVELSSATLYVWNSSGSLVGTNTTTITGTNQNVSLNLNLGTTDGVYYWNYKGVDSSSNEAFASNNFTLNLDTTIPILTVTTYTETINYNINFSSLITCSDTNLDYCNVTTDEGNTFTYTNTSYTFLTNGNHSFNVTAVDLAGNTQTSLNNVIFINPEIYFIFNHSGTLINDFSFGSKSTTNGSLFYSVYGDSLILGNNTFTWESLGYITQNITFEITDTVTSPFVYNVSNSIINVEIRDKIDFSLITGYNFSLTFIATVGTTTSTTTGLASVNDLLFLNEQYKLIVSNTNYETENIFFNFDNQENLTVMAYMTNSSITQNGFVIVSVTGDNGEPLENVIVQAKQWDSSSNAYIATSQSLTGNDGKGTLNVILNDKAYIFTAIRNGDTKTTPFETITTDENGKTIPFSFQSSKDAFTYSLGKYNGIATESFNNVTNVSTITFQFSHDDNIVITGCINEYKLIDYVEVLTNTSCVSSAGVTFFDSYFINSSQKTSLKAEFYIGNTYKTVEVFTYAPVISIQNLLLTTGLHAFIYLLLIGLSIWIGFELLDNVYISLILVIVSGFFSSKLIPTMLPNDIAVIFGVMAVLTLWGIYKRK